MLQHEWVNSRGAIIRFMRRAIEIRVLDVQECVKADVAVALFVREALRWMVEQLRSGDMALPDHEVLVADFTAVIRRGQAAAVDAPHLRPGRRRPKTARAVLELLGERVAERTPLPERTFLPLLADRIDRGNLSERIASRVRRRGTRSGQTRRTAIRDVYEELATCLRDNAAWDG